MTIQTDFIQVEHDRMALMRYDSAVILKRFFFVEESLIKSIAGWIPGTAHLILKTEYAKIMWQNAKTAEDMRQRVYELRYPSRLMSKEGEEELIRLVDEARNAPNALAFFNSMLMVFVPALRDAYQQYVNLADVIGDGPSIRFMNLAIKEKEDQIAVLELYKDDLFRLYPEQDHVEAKLWVDELKIRLNAIGAISLNKSEAPLIEDIKSLANRKEFKIAQNPAREHSFANVRFYWPDIIVDGYPYGEGVQLQIRSAVSHINEVWAVEACAAFTYGLSDELGWEFILDAARWTYDEARHCRMGYERLASWGFEKFEIPLGTYIYDAAKDNDPIYRLGMLFFFETKNINKKPKRAQKFREYSDTLSEHDMDFDWADETIHAHYGNKWLTKLLEVRGANTDPKIVRQKCEELVDTIVSNATDDEREKILFLANSMLTKAGKLAKKNL
ncbi:DUF455 family protein [Candidatus Peregrinibacteria bacterium]|jgi:hypothetical protein|nr:DUF455 family protein [Candidatus Peregrinibacteria bacterium]